jgi:hypothetical protein
MRLYHIAAATLLIGTSAFAFQDDKMGEAPVAGTASTAPERDAGDPDLDLAVDPATVPDSAPQSDAIDTTYAGVGGPDLEEAAASPALLAVADTSPRPAAQNYRACAPGPGDDNCIQLYEPGVRTALAAWTGPSDADARGVGGPYVPVEGGADESAMNGDGVLDPALGETIDLG